MISNSPSSEPAPISLERAKQLEIIRDTNKPLHIYKLKAYLENKDTKQAVLDRIKSSSLIQLIDLEAQLKKATFNFNDNDFWLTLQTQFISVIKNAKYDSIINLSPEQLLYCFANQYDALTEKLKEFNRAQLDQLLLKFPNLEDEKASCLSTLINMVKTDYSRNGFRAHILKLKNDHADKELKMMANHFGLQTLTHGQVVPGSAIDIEWGGNKIDDSLMATAFKHLSHDPEALSKKMADIYSKTSENDFEPDTLSIQLKKEHSKAGNYNLATIVSHIDTPSVCCAIRLSVAAMGEKKSSEQRQQEVIAAQITDNKELLTDESFSTFKAESIYLQKFLDAEPDINYELINSFFLSLLENAIYYSTPIELKLSYDERLKRIENNFFACSQRLIANYAEIDKIFTDAILVVENEHKRLQNDKGTFFIANGGGKAAVLFDAFKNMTNNVCTFLMNPAQPIQTLRNNIHVNVANCLQHPVLNESRNQTADILLAVLGVILFIPTGGATYWDAKCYNTFFGAPRVVTNLKTSSQLLNTPALIK